MPEQPTFPPEVQAVLGEIYHVTMPKQGATSQVWVVECAAGIRVIKHTSRAPYVDWLMNEGSILKSLESSNHNAESRSKPELRVPFPYPKFYLDGSLMKIGRPIPYLVMGWLPGEPLSTVMSRENDLNQRLYWMRLFGDVLRKIHQFPSLLWKRGNWPEERLDTAAGYIRDGLELDADDAPRLLEQLRAERPADVQQTFIHGDFMWDNVLVQDDQISGIVDWGGGAYGDPRYDLALAILPHEDGEISSAEVAAFYAGYGREPLTDSEYHYFINLYEFF